jgi:ABC-type lipopolysaccharide export system ATPase subunit
MGNPLIRTKSHHLHAKKVMVTIFSGLVALLPPNGSLKVTEFFNYVGILVRFVGSHLDM